MSLKLSNLKLSPEDIASWTTKDTIKLCSLDGGGALGIGPALYLAKASSEFDLEFDAYCGSSVGALLAMLYATEHSFQDAYTIFKSAVTSIFAKPSILWRCDPSLPKYDSANLRSACVKHFGTMKMSDVKKPVFITTADFATGRAKIWDSSDDALIVDVVMCSTAAPTYFAPINSRYADGGLVANNPSMIGVGGLASMDVSTAKMRVLSLASGGSFWKNPSIGRRMLQLQWVTPLIDFMLDGNEERDEFIANQLLGRNHLRIKPNDTKSYAMDNLDILDEWQALWTSAYDDSKSALSEWLKVEA